MTLQIGLVGSDGIVLASDRLVNVYEGGDYTLSLRSKFYSNDGVVCCWSGDAVARHAAAYVSDSEWSDTDRDKQLRSCSDRAWQLQFGTLKVPMVQQMTRRKLLVAFPSDCSLWEVELSDSSLAERVLDKTVAGSDRTTIKHLINNYVPRDSVSVDRLVLIAAHAILIGHREQNGDIDGLQVSIIKKGEPPLFLSTEQENELIKRSSAIHNLLSEQLLQPFDYRPVTPKQS